MGFITKMYWRRVQNTAAAAGLVVGMLVASSAHAGETVSIKTPLGRASPRESVESAKGTIEHQIIESLKMIQDGQLMHGEKHTATQRSVIRMCLNKSKISISKPQRQQSFVFRRILFGLPSERDPKNPNVVKIFISCGETRMPVPSTHEKLKDKWYVQVFSW